MPSALQNIITVSTRRGHNLTNRSTDIQAAFQGLFSNEKLKDFDTNSRQPFKTNDAVHGFSIGSSKSYLDPATGEVIFYKLTKSDNNNAEWQGVRLTGNNAAIDDPNKIDQSNGIGQDSIGDSLQVY